MDEYVLLMRLDILAKDAQPSPEQMQVYMKQYNDWVGGIAAQNKFVGGTGLSIAGFITVRAKDFDEASKFAQACPILRGVGNTVELRKIVSVHENGK
jgi:hypothetical protein